MKKQIGGMGYTGTYAVIHFKDGERKVIEGVFSSPDELDYLASSLEYPVSAIYAMEKREPFESAICVCEWKS
jgi:hypothetical protein